MTNLFNKIWFEGRRSIRAVRGAQRQFQISPWSAALRLLYARIRYRHGPQSFSIYRLAGRPLFEGGKYLWEPAVLQQLAAINPSPQKLIARNKRDFWLHCLNHNIRAVPIIFSAMPREANGCTMALAHNDDRDARSIFCDALLNENNVFFKPMSGAHGAGAFAARRAGQEWTYQGITSDPDTLYRYCSVSHFKGGNWVCQPQVEPHDELKRIMAPGALGTIRLITYLSGKSPILAFAVIRIPVGNNVTDNFSQGTGGNIVASVALDTGRIGPGWHSVSTDWPEIEPVTTHPDTLCQIEGSIAPFWRETRELACLGQSVTPQLPTIGWDIAVTNSGPTVIEANTEYGIDLLQIAHNRGLKNEIMPILRELLIKEGRL